MKKHLLQITLFFLMVTLTAGTFYTGTGHLWTPFDDAIGVALPAGKAGTGTLKEDISDFALTHEIKPVDAKLDSVWKAIPGYEGVKVNIDKSFKAMRKDGRFNEEKIVYESTSPKKHLSDLPPAPIYRGNPEKPMVTLLINVAWGNEYLPDLLKTLKSQNVKATFFLDGSWTKKNPELANMIKEEGHEIGNHAYSHPDMSRLTSAKAEEEIAKTNDIIQATLGIKPKYFAPPSGSFNENTIKIAAGLNMQTILWTADTVDWKNPPPNQMVSRVAGKVESGSMILMHPTASTSEGLNDLINAIKERGYTIGTVSQMLSEERVTPARKSK